MKYTSIINRDDGSRLQRVDSVLETLNDETAIQLMELYPEWRVGLVITQDDVDNGFRLRYNDKLYKVNHPHTTQADWVPGNVPALYTEISLEEFPPFVHPTGAHDAYNEGDGMTYTDGYRYRSKYDGNVWSPDENPDWWERVE